MEIHWHRGNDRASVTPVGGHDDVRSMPAIVEDGSVGYRANVHTRVRTHCSIGIVASRRTASGKRTKRERGKRESSVLHDGVFSPCVDLLSWSERMMNDRLQL
jgi:hypothetical protein